VGKWLKKVGAKQVIELDWWQSHQMKEEGRSLEFHAVPAQHFSGRTPFHYNKSLWCGWVVRVHCRNGLTKVFYFSGDTGYNEVDFKEIGERFKGVDLSLIPIGVYSPRQFMRPVHAGPREAVLIHQEVQSKLSVGMHWGTFKLSSEPRQQPPYDLYCAMVEHALPIKAFRALQPGETINW
jgi:N-acyl-phosphatidylethanolamine-hydrolysing phospholipase D